MHDFNLANFVSSDPLAFEELGEVSPLETPLLRLGGMQLINHREVGHREVGVTRLFLAVDGHLLAAPSFARRAFSWGRPLPREPPL